MQHTPVSLVGRAAELHALKSLVTAARNGVSGAAVVTGEPGIGKSALLDAAVEAQQGIRLVRSDGYEAEAAIPYAALQRVGLALGAHLDALPHRQRQALLVALAAEDGPAPDRFLVGLAMLALFAEASRETPVVCVVDDAHWLDSESQAVLAFVARRVQAEAVVLLFATRDNDDVGMRFAGIRTIGLTGLDTTSSMSLLQRATMHLIDPPVAARIADATAGNPLALIDLANDLSIRQLTDLSLSAGPVPIGRYLEAHYLRLVRETSGEVQAWLQLAAAESSGHPLVIANAAKRLELSVDAAADAARAGLVVAEDVVSFRHPLVRSAVYAATPGRKRRRAHSALAHEARLLGLVELEAWHSAQATLGPDPEVAQRLEDVADRAARRGGLVSMASLLVRAAELTPPGRERNGRLLAAAEAATDAGAAHLATGLLDRVDPEDLDDVGRGRMIFTRAELAVFVADPAEVLHSTANMMRAADYFHGHEPAREQKALMRAFELVLVAQQYSDTPLPELGRRLQAGAEVRDGPDAVVLRALGAHILLPYADAVPLMREAVAVLSALEDAALPGFGFVGFVFTTALFDECGSLEYLGRLAGYARDVGDLRFLDTVLWLRSAFEINRGDPAAAARFVDEVREVRRAIGHDAENVVNAAYLAWTDTPAEHIEAIADITGAMGFGGAQSIAFAGLAIREIAEGRYLRAHDRLAPMVAQPFLQVTYHQLADFVEAAARSGHAAAADEVAARLAMMRRHNPSRWLAGLDHRSAALVAADGDAEAHYRAAVDIFADTAVPAELGRAHLVYGEWLRRVKRRREAKEQLRSAIDLFDRIEAPAFARRARTELAAIGESVSDREVVGGVEMSPREAAVARLAGVGQTNAEIAAALFISTNTVDYHLRKVFQKLGVSSRRQLRERFGRAD